jgi:pimeloyl-ACP methyl ester carboxylesterase
MRLSLTWKLIISILLVATTTVNADEVSDVWAEFIRAENEGDLEVIAPILHPDVIYVLPDERPVFGREAVLELMGVIHIRFEIATSYDLEPVLREENRRVEHGTMRMDFTPRSGGESQSLTVPCASELVRVDGRWLQRELLLGSTGPVEELVPGLPDPTGVHPVGVVSLILGDTERRDPFTGEAPRQVAVEIWYPAIPVSEIKTRNYASPEVARALASFLELPSAFSSFLSHVPTNSLPGAPPGDGPFPLVIYNHGYSGFTGVHQALYEELASHGYLVASVGHAHESALFVRNDGSCIPFDRDGDAHRSRMEETGLEAPEAAKDRILRATNIDERRQAYEDLVRLSPLHQESTRIWTDDSQFILDQLAAMNLSSGRFAGLLDLDRVGVIGHSLGGAVAGQLVLVDKRVKVGINLDGFQFGDLIHSHLDKPFMFMGAQRPWAGENTISNDLFFVESTAPACVAVMSGFEHATFTDLAVFGMVSGIGDSIEGGQRAMALQREYILAFFDLQLRGIESELFNGSPSGAAEVHLRCRNW